MIIGDFLFWNNQMVKADDSTIIGESDGVVYEVLRIIDGIPLFFDDHFDRLLHSCELIGKSIGTDAAAIFKQIVELSKRNRLAAGNVMIKVIFQATSSDMLIHYMPHSYPSDADYKNGVEVSFLDAQRVNPEAKVIQPSIRNTANKIIIETGVYEVLLVGLDHQITEGSRSNLFFIKDNSLFTTPLFKVLKGVTLSKVLKIAMNESITVHFENIDSRKLDSFDAMFITGTSPQVLSVRKAGEYTFDVMHPLILKISEIFNRMVASDIEQKRQWSLGK